ncbi:hypothetical protein BLA17378_04516 [Burkholderia aenigmatica]|uniref:Uncharacterized protein n=1 Tax=Burkholderia aenigmatica TaxID=2015348 RepID=A0ABY6XVK6_9BURK|nr:hypothetical protein [Burkholderia aenigmatica]VWC90231.1 hypothetical protein BLA17378_04516 [Burkholderia aenigmatica]
MKRVFWIAQIIYLVALFISLIFVVRGAFQAEHVLSARLNADLTRLEKAIDQIESSGGDSGDDNNAQPTVQPLGCKEWSISPCSYKT